MTDNWVPSAVSYQRARVDCKVCQSDGAQRDASVRISHRLQTRRVAEGTYALYSGGGWWGAFGKNGCL